MKAHTEDEFENFISQLLATNADLGFYCDFEKIKQNVKEIEISLNTLNYLLGKEDLESAVKDLWERDPLIFKALLILIAVRTEQRKKVITRNGSICDIEHYLTSIDGVLEFLKGTGLDKLFRDKTIKNLVDYVFGIEVGLDSHARKNRSGKTMERLVANIFEQNKIKFSKEIYSTCFPEVQKAFGEDIKRFDFVIKTKLKTYLLEVNFYSGGGSKPNEVARAYTEIAPKINAITNYEFVWITDGLGWKVASSMIKAAFMEIPSIYNLTNIKRFIEQIKREGQE